MKPIIKWAGGKAATAGSIWGAIRDHNPFVTEGDYTWSEPFVGAGGMYLGRPANVRPPYTAYLYDANVRLVDLHACVRSTPEAVYHELCQLPQARTDVQTYKALVARFNVSPAGPARAALFIWLNKHCFNGLYRENQSGFFNVPIGRSASGPTLPSLSDIQCVSVALQYADIRSGSVHDTLAAPAHLRSVQVDRHVVYLDPPYLPPGEVADAYTSYTSCPFKDADHRQMVAAVAALPPQVDVWASGSGGAATEAAYLDSGVFERVLAIPVQRSVGGAAKSRVSTSEWLMRRRRGGK